MDARAPTIEQPPPWGYLATIGWTLLALIVSTGAAYLVYVRWLGGDIARATELSYDGVLVAASSLASMPVQIVVVLVAVRLRRWPIAQYLALIVPQARQAAYALVAMFALIFAVEGTLYVLGQELVPPFQTDSYRTAKAAGWLVPLFFVIVVLAPVTEEIVFRGFVYRGFVRKPGDEPIAILVLTVAWVLLHVQYDIVGLLQVFIVGLFFGAVRWWSGSTLLTMSLHVIMNLEAMIETVIRVEWHG